ncbi:MAG: P22 phage major capsid protein family protein [Clostridia bacterium]|nr:P22 phage major capsid protein family protein [Clostridia bacterium]
MANTFLTLKTIARQALPRLAENLVFPNLVHRDFSDTFSSLGDEIQIRKPNVLEARDFTVGNEVQYQDMKDSSVTVKLDKLATVDVKASAIETALNIDDLNRVFIEPASVALAEKINAEGLELYKDIPTYVGAAGTTPAAISVMAAARKQLNIQKVPVSGRVAVWDPEADASFSTLDAILHAEKSGSTQALREGSIGRVMGLDNYMAQSVAKHTVGATGTPLVDYSSGYTKGAEKIHVDGLTTAFVEGDLFTIAGDTTKYTVVKAGAISTADQDIDIYPALSKNTADNAAITVVTSHTANLAFNPLAFAFVTRPLYNPDGEGVAAYVTSYNGISLRVTKGYNAKLKESAYSMDVLYAYKTIYPELACRVLG